MTWRVLVIVPARDDAVEGAEVHGGSDERKQQRLRHRLIGSTKLL
jgi:hypothetical protein